MTPLQIVGATAGTILVVILVLLALWKYWFLRDPERDIPQGNVLVSPADGRVIAVWPFGPNTTSARIPKGLLGAYRTLLSDVAEEGTVISIFMSPADVHHNRSPMAGKVLSQRHTPGKFHAASRDDALIENERNEILLRSGGFTIKVIQVAGFLVRRIVSRVQPGDMLARGQRIGLINLGSQCTVIVPHAGVRIVVAEGQRVLAGSSILAEVDPQVATV